MSSIKPIKDSNPDKAKSRDKSRVKDGADVFTHKRAQGDLRFLVLCDHAYNYVPPTFQNLGLDGDILSRHIAFDIGAVAVAEIISETLNCPFIVPHFSRLVIDPNRGLDDPTLIVTHSDGIAIPDNQNLSQAERQTRIETYYTPYHNAIANAIAHALAEGVVPVILSIHSFTPIWQGVVRPWHIGLLWDKDDRLKVHIKTYLQAMSDLPPDLCIGDNQPYSGQLKGDCLYQHGTGNGLPHVLVELRHDVIADAHAQAVWGARLAAAARDFIQNEALYCVRHYGSAFD